MRAHPECEMQPDLSEKSVQLNRKYYYQSLIAAFIAPDRVTRPVLGLDPFFMSKEYRGGHSSSVILIEKYYQG